LAGTGKAFRPASAVLASWLAMLGIDLVLHAGILAPLYDWGSPFLLQPEEAFVRIPIGYAAFLLLAIGLVWLLPRVGARDGRAGAVVAGVAAALGWGAFVLGLWSISTASPGLLLGWWAGQTAELAVGGYVIGALIAGVRLRRVALLVAALVATCAIVAIVLQSVGYAAPPVVRS
jgi:hypothetical protein